MKFGAGGGGGGGAGAEEDDEAEPFGLRFGIQVDFEPV